MLHATLITEAGRGDVYTARRELDPIPEELLQAVKERVAKRMRGNAIEQGAREGLG